MSKPNEKDDGSKLSDKVKQLFGIKSKIPGATGPTKPLTPEYNLTSDLIRDISLGTPTNHRLKTIKELSEIVRTKCLEETGTEVLWNSTKDLLDQTLASDDRQTLQKFFCCVIEGQYEHLGMMRSQFFIMMQHQTDDLNFRIDLLKVLTKNGKDLGYYEVEIGECLLSLMHGSASKTRTTDFLNLLLNIVKFNAAYLEEDAITGLVIYVCNIGSSTVSDEDAEMCLKVLEALISFCYLPSNSLHQFLICLCQIINRESLAQPTWSLMRKLLGTHLGHSAIYKMCQILDDKSDKYKNSASLLRGAIFFIGMALWGSKKVPSLKHPPATVLPFFFQAMTRNKSVLIIYEVVLNVNRLVVKSNPDLSTSAWDSIMDITKAAMDHVENDPDCPANVYSELHDFLTAMENLYVAGKFYGPTERLFELLESCVAKRSENSVMTLISYRAKDISPLQMRWIEPLNSLLQRYFVNESRPAVRSKILETLSEIVGSHGTVYRDELIHSVILPNLADIDKEVNSSIKMRAIQLVIDLALLSTVDQFNPLHDILKKISSRSIPCCSINAVSNCSSIIPEKIHDELRLVITGSIKIFKTSLFKLKSSINAVRVFSFLVTSARCLLLHHQSSSDSASLRKIILGCLLDLRADNNGFIGITDDDKLAFSTNVLCNQRYSSTLTSGEVVLPYRDAFMLICETLEQELDWTILLLVLERLPFVLQNKVLLFDAFPREIERLAGLTCRMFNDRRQFTNTPAQFNKSYLHSYIYPVLFCFISFHTELDKNRQLELVKCLETGLVSICARSCVRCLNVCALEIPTIIMRLLPSLLLTLSKISATVAMAIPLMEFLSSLIHLPELYSNFVEGDYKSIFAVALPYTNPFKYSHYTVSLAYHVISMWFIKCRLPFRHGFVQFISKGLKIHVLRPIDESESFRMRSNQDSSDRNRTFSLNEEALRRKANAAAATKARGPNVATIDQPTTTTAATPSISAVPDQSVSANFHKELTDTCYDMLARYAYSTNSSVPKRSPIAEFLLAGGQSQSWLIGNSIVTVTTSGGMKVGKSGLCEKCLSIARSSQTSSPNDEVSRRRHKSAAVGRIKEDIPMLPLLVSKDDMQLNKRSPREVTIDDRFTSEGNGLLSEAEKIQAVDSVLIGLKVNPADHSIFTSHACNCWCTQWAEIHVRRPTGNFSWMMRMQNEQDILAMFPDYLLQDVSNLFKLPPDDEEKNECSTIIESDPDAIAKECLEFGLEDVDKKYIHNARTRSSPGLTTEFQQQLQPLNLMQEMQDDEMIQGPVDNKVEMRQGSSTTSDNTTKINRRSAILSSVSEENDLQTTEVKRSSSLSSGQPNPVRVRPASGVGSTSGTSVGLTSAGLTSAGLTSAGLTSAGLTSAGLTSAGLTSAGLTSAGLTSAGLTSAGLTSAGLTSAGLAPTAIQGGVDPYFPFLQLFHSQCIGKNLEDLPIPLPKNDAACNSVKMLDLICPYESHKIGVIYVKPGQCKSELSILSNMYGSVRYIAFIRSLGHLLRLVDCDPHTTYLGGLDNKGNDGQFTYAWQAEFMQVVFHIVTMMPYIEHDKNFTEKKKHIGNDYVTIVYNDSGEEYKMGTIKGQFNFVNIVIKPLDHSTNEVTVQTKAEIEDMIGHTDTKIISDKNLGVLVRQMAIHANLAATIFAKQKVHPNNPYASNWLERLRQIKRIRDRILQDPSKSDPSAPPPNLNCIYGDLAAFAQ